MNLSSKTKADCDGLCPGLYALTARYYHVTILACHTAVTCDSWLSTLNGSGTNPEALCDTREEREQPVLLLLTTHPYQARWDTLGS